MSECKTVYKDLETGIVYKEKRKADDMYQKGHRIQVCDQNVGDRQLSPTCEWIPGSDDYYVFYGNEKVLHRCRSSSIGGAPAFQAGGRGFEARLRLHRGMGTPNASLFTNGQSTRTGRERQKGYG